MVTLAYICSLLHRDILALVVTTLLLDVPSSLGRAITQALQKFWILIEYNVDLCGGHLARVTGGG